MSNSYLHIINVVHTHTHNAQLHRSLVANMRATKTRQSRKVGRDFCIARERPQRSTIESNASRLVKFIRYSARAQTSVNSVELTIAAVSGKSD